MVMVCSNLIATVYAAQGLGAYTMVYAAQGPGSHTTVYGMYGCMAGSGVLLGMVEVCYHRWVTVTIIQYILTSM